MAQLVAMWLERQQIRSASAIISFPAIREGKRSNEDADGSSLPLHHQQPLYDQQAG